MDAPNPLAMEGRDAVAHPPVAPPWAGADEGGVTEQRRGNADRDKFEQPATAAAAGERLQMFLTFIMFAVRRSMFCRKGRCHVLSNTLWASCKLSAVF